MDTAPRRGSCSRQGIDGILDATATATGIRIHVSVPTDALLPVIASEQLHQGSGGYGLLLAALGSGAVGGALGMEPLRNALTANQLLLFSGLLYGDGAELPSATPAQVFTALQPDELLRNGALQMADHHAAGGNATYVYRFDYHPAQDPDRLGAAHCVELPFLFDTFDSYSDGPMSGTPSDTARALGRSFATAVAAFGATGSASGWLPCAPAPAQRSEGRRARCPWPIRVQWKAPSRRKRGGTYQACALDAGENGRHLNVGDMRHGPTVPVRNA
jgi:hypothetical protein